MQEFRQSINNLIRSDRPESPTNLMFIVGLLSLIAWEWYALLTRGTVPHVETLAALIFGIKVAKGYNDRSTKGGGDVQAQTAGPGGDVDKG